MIHEVFRGSFGSKAAPFLFKLVAMIYFITNQLQYQPTVTYSLSTVTHFLEWANKVSKFGVDTETTGEYNGGTGKILLLQIGVPDVQWVFDWQGLNPTDKSSILNVLKDETKLKIFQNAKFDLKFFFEQDCYVTNIYDTMVAERLIHAGKDMPKGTAALDTLAMKYAGVQLDKSIRGRIHSEGFTDTVINYASQDVAVLEPIMQAQHKQLMQLNMACEDIQDLNTVLGIENGACLCLALMEFNGVLLDVPAWQKITHDIAKQILSLEGELDSIVIKDKLFDNIGKRQLNLFESANSGINWKSPMQKLKVLKRIDASVEDTAERTLKRIHKKHPIVPKLQDYIQLIKLYTGFCTTLPKQINTKTGRIHMSLQQNLKTGRIAASNPNLLQIPSRTSYGKSMRECFIAANGYNIVGGDLAQAELRLLTQASKDPLWIQIFNEDKDLHSTLCASTFGIPSSCK